MQMTDTELAGTIWPIYCGAGRPRQLSAVGAVSLRGAGGETRTPSLLLTRVGKLHARYQRMKTPQKRPGP